MRYPILHSSGTASRVGAACTSVSSSAVVMKIGESLASGMRSGRSSEESSRKQVKGQPASTSSARTASISSWLYSSEGEAIEAGSPKLQPSDSSGGMVEAK